MPLYIENSTHWRTPDIQRVVKAAMVAAGCDLSKTRRVNVAYNTRRVNTRTQRGVKSRRSKIVPQSNIELEFNSGPRTTRIKLKLPKNGPKDAHPNPMIAIALEAAVDPDRTVLAPSQSFWLANFLAFKFAGESTATTPQADWREGSASLVPPEWAKFEDLLIYKVKDPLQDGTYLDFVAKKEAALARTEKSIEQYIKYIEDMKRKLKKLRAKKKEIERSLASAKERRT